jgi:DNA polymerase-1
VRVVVVDRRDGSGVLQPLHDDDAPAGPPEPTDDLATAIARREEAEHPRWVWADTADTYPLLVEAGIRVEQVHDLALTEATVLGHAGRWGAPRSLAAAWARAHGGAEPADRAQRLDRTGQQPLFDAVGDRLPAGVDPLEAAIAVHAAQRRWIRAPEPHPAYESTPVSPRSLDLLVAADSAGALAAVEMSHAGLPWRPDVHDRLLTDALGPRPTHGARPAKLQALADEVAAALATPYLNPDSPAEVVRAFGRAGVTVTSTRAHVLREIDHPAIAPLLSYKALVRLHTAHGWAWRDTWVRDGRFHPEYVPAGVVSGRWASRGGGALQIPRVVRGAVVADPGCVLVVADAQQLEPRVLAALAADPDMTQAAAEGDLYAGLAAQAFGGDRAQAKVGLLSAMYGGSSPALATLTRRYPAALALVEAAARTGEAGGMVRSVLGRTSPPPGPGRDDLGERQALRRARDWGRFTRNFVIQASAADWAAVLLALLRRRLAVIADGAAELVFFQHDEVVVHGPVGSGDDVAQAVTEAAEEATRLVFGATPVRLPLTTAVVADYAAAK